MSARVGYGRGYYGDGQLAKDPPRRRSWFKIVAVLGAGAAITWFLWPRRSAPKFISEPGPINEAPSVPAVSSANVVYAPTEAVGAFLKRLEDDARARGFTSVKDYEDSVITSAKQLQAAGAQVVLAPHLQHLASRLGL